MPGSREENEGDVHTKSVPESASPWPSMRNDDDLIVMDLTAREKKFDPKDDGEEVVSGLRLKVPDVKALRESMKLSQSAFATRFGLSLDALQNWEQRRRMPDRTARILIRLIDAAPDLVERVADEESAANP